MIAETRLEILTDLERNVDEVLDAWRYLRTELPNPGLNRSVERNLQRIGDRAAARLEEAER